MVTLKQLAKELNVSISTVSKALNNSEEIGKETIKRVKELAELYNYKPNKVALSLKQNRTNTIGVIIPDILNYFLAKVLYGIEREASKHGYNIMTCISNESLEKEKESLQILANGSVDGFILCVSEETQIKNEIKHFENIIKQGLPIVMFDRVAHDVFCDKVIVDDFDATYRATQKLLKENRKHIAFISTISDLSVGKLREQGYNKAILEHPANKKITLKIQKEDNAHEKIEAFLQAHKNIDAVIAADSTSGITSINIAKSFGLNVPKDISVIGFSSQTFAKLSLPKLTTIRQHAKEIGANAAQMLIERLQSQDKLKEQRDFRTKIVKTSLVENGSTLSL
ncbi:LacI family transcriptional regulator [Oceanihabitans sp. IOP_32]|uniref:LacI family DNA-binding transcriptional regulator n=1 Tax=Oceanihabitans sp. IOP_32 TaxID=2529032 RepID=UPI0012933AD5|nr:LacI family DNA-binding transcriptional regulator [Oceanihabitans sp. IOP_32]QFZ54757.1 LacI family transcriptional regulator [Oceanihabitans sp. IOP_32]